MGETIASSIAYVASLVFVGLPSGATHLVELSQAPYFSSYEKVAEKNFTLQPEKTYDFYKSDNGISCVDSSERAMHRKKYSQSIVYDAKPIMIKKNDTYSITDVNYISVPIDNAINSLNEKVTISYNNESFSIILGDKDYGLSVKERIDILEKCLLF